MKRMDLPPIWLVVFMAAAWALAQVAPAVILGPRPFTAAMCTLAGVVLIAWSAIWFMRHSTPIEPRKTPRVLLASGPYRLNRNPIYTGLALILLGWGLWLGALTAVLATPVFMALIDRRFVRAEEQGLRDAFGPEAERWLARTRRW